MYKFFHKGYICIKGTNIPRLLEVRWRIQRFKATHANHSKCCIVNLLILNIGHYLTIPDQNTETEYRLDTIELGSK